LGSLGRQGQGSDYWQG